MLKRLRKAREKNVNDRLRYVVNRFFVAAICLYLFGGLQVVNGTNTTLLCKVYADESNGIGVLGEDFEPSIIEYLSSGTEFTFTGRFWSTRNGKYGYHFTYSQEKEDGSKTSFAFFVKDETDGDVLSSLKDVSYEDEIYVIMKAVYDKTEYTDQQTIHYVTVSDAEIVENTIDYTEAYSVAVDEMETEADGWDVYYSLCDLDNDGIYEIIFQWGSNAAYYNHVWTIDSEGEAYHVGCFYNAQSFYVAPDYNGIFGVYGHMGYEIVTRITLSGGAIVEETISEGDIGDSDYFSNDMPVYSYDVFDWNSTIEEAINMLENYKEFNASMDDNLIDSSDSETDALIVLEEENDEPEWDGLSDEEWYEEVQAYWYEKTLGFLGGTWEWISDEDVSDELYDEIIEFISDYIDYDLYFNVYYDGDEEYARNHFISIYNDIKYIEATYYIEPGSAAVYLIDFCGYTIQDVRNMTWYNILSLYEEYSLGLLEEYNSSGSNTQNILDDNTSEENDYFKDGVSNDYFSVSGALDTEKIINDFHEKGFTYVWLESHKVQLPDSGILGDTGTTETVYLRLTYVDESNLYYVVYEGEAIYKYWGGTIGWSMFSDIATLLDCNLSGFNNTYWKILDDDWWTRYNIASSLIEELNLDIIEEQLEDESEDLPFVMGESNIEVYFKFENFDKIYSKIESVINYEDIALYSDATLGEIVVVLGGTIYKQELDDGLYSNYSNIDLNQNHVQLSIAHEWEYYDDYKDYENLYYIPTVDENSNLRRWTISGFLYQISEEEYLSAMNGNESEFEEEEESEVIIVIE